MLQFHSLLASVQSHRSLSGSESFGANTRRQPCHVPEFGYPVHLPQRIRVHRIVRRLADRNSSARVPKDERKPVRRRRWYSGGPLSVSVSVSVPRNTGADLWAWTVIGLLPRLTTLNRSEIGYRERQDAEIAFVQQAVLPGSTRHSALSAKYDIAPKPKPMPAATKTLQLTFRCVPPTSTTASNAATKNILPSMTVHLIAQLCRRLFGLKPSDPIDLYYQSAASSSSSSGPDRVLLDDPRQAIATYGICGPGDITAHLHPGHCPK